MLEFKIFLVYKLRDKKQSFAFIKSDLNIKSWNFREKKN